MFKDAGDDIEDINVLKVTKSEESPRDFTSRFSSVEARGGAVICILLQLI